MKIEDSPFQFTTTVDQGKVRRVMGTNTAGFDMLDLAFIELLGTVGSPDKPGVAQDVIKTELDKTEKKSSVDKSHDTLEDKPVAKADDTPPVTRSEERKDSVQKELAIFHKQMTPTDIQYMKDVVIPGLPILQGSVPLQSIFPVDENSGGFNFHDYEISQKLADLVKSGYKTGRPFRVEMDENSSVIMKIKNGKVSAEFISTDRAAALFIKQELDELRQRMATKNLPIDLISYREQKQQRQQRDDNNNDDV